MLADKEYEAKSKSAREVNGKQEGGQGDEIRGIDYGQGCSYSSSAKFSVIQLLCQTLMLLKALVLTAPVKPIRPLQFIRLRFIR